MTFPTPPEAQQDGGDGSSGVSQLRQRRTGGIPFTIAEEEGEDVGVAERPNPALRSRRRKSSFMTDDSSSMEDRHSSLRSSAHNRRPSYRASTDSLLSPPRATSHDEHILEEPSIWYSAPLLFAIVPAIGGVAFTKGSILLTDLALLALAAVYLNWCLITPWLWYHSAQSVRVAKPSMPGAVPEEAIQDGVDDARNDHDESVPDAGDYPTQADASPPPSDPAKTNPAAGVSDSSSQTREASAELALHELTALAFCILGPLFGSYVLHFIRSSLLSLQGGQLVSNLHLTLFVLGAELRPVRHCIKLVQARTLYLQHIVRSDQYAQSREQMSNHGDFAELQERLVDLETAASASAEQRSSAVEKALPSATPEDVKRTQQALQTQIDALNRAVRRYEKRETKQLVQNEERLHDIEVRLREALSLAAVAAQYSQKPGLVMRLLEWITGWMRWVFSIFVWPFAWLVDMQWAVVTKLGLARPMRRGTSRKDERTRRADGMRDGRPRLLARKRVEGQTRPGEGTLKTRRQD